MIKAAITSFISKLQVLDLKPSSKLAFSDLGKITLVLELSCALPTA